MRPKVEVTIRYTAGGKTRTTTFDPREVGISLLMFDRHAVDIIGAWYDANKDKQYKISKDEAIARWGKRMEKFFPKNERTMDSKLLAEVWGPDDASRSLTGDDEELPGVLSKLPRCFIGDGT